jgi:hypothetical protein
LCVVGVSVVIEVFESEDEVVDRLFVSEVGEYISCSFVDAVQVVCALTEPAAEIVVELVTKCLVAAERFMGEHSISECFELLVELRRGFVCVGFVRFEMVSAVAEHP